MTKKNNDIFKIILVVIVLIIVFIIGMLIGKNLLQSNSNKENKNISNIEEDEFKNIRINEDFSKDGYIENLDNVRWNNARITQYDEEMEISITLNNDLEIEKIESRTLTVNLLDKEGKIIYTKDVEMEEIPENYGYTFLELKFEIEEPIIIYDVQIIAK